MKKSVRILLILIALVCFGVALYYPISEYVMQKQSVDTMDRLAALRDAGREAAVSLETEAPVPPVPEGENAETEAPAPDITANEDEQPAETEASQSAAISAQQTDDEIASATEAPGAEQRHEASTTAEGTVNETVAPAGNDAENPDMPDSDQTPSSEPAPSPTPTATPDRHVTTGAKIWADVEKVAFDESKILPQYRELYSINNDMVGWLTVSEVPGRRLSIDLPVMQKEDENYYLSHDFFHKDNANGLLILDYHCDPYTPSYNLVVSGHNRKNDTIFSKLFDYYQDKRHWEVHKLIQFDSLMEERTYVVFAAFFSADYDVDEEGFRYNANIEYSIDAKQWIREIDSYKLYDTGIDTAFGDQFLTLTTCNSSQRKNGRFVVVARRVREGETFE